MSLTWLHISDFHIRQGDPYDRDVVLKALVESVADYRERGRAPDLIFATGDIAHAGKLQEYELATRFFDDLLKATCLDKRHLFVIPGNHDVDLDLGVGLARTLESNEEANKYFHPDHPKAHLTLKLGAFAVWHNQYFQGIRAAPANSTCGPVELLEINGHRLGILPINSALFCQGKDDDHDKLWIGRRCLKSALEELSRLEAEVNIALIHHPIDWLCNSECSNIRGELESSVDFLLRGHLHEARIETVASAEGQLLHCAAGAAYQTRKWPNRALYGTLDGGQLTIFPIRYEDAPHEIWTTDPSVFPRDLNHERGFDIPRAKGVKAVPAPPAPAGPAPVPRFRSNIPSRGTRPFVGRDSLIQEIQAALGDTGGERVLLLHGPPGVGKSEVALEFARQHRDRYPGGTFLLDASTGAIAVDFARIGNHILDLQFSPDEKVEDQGQTTFFALGGSPVLLIYDNVVSFDALKPWLPRAGMPCHVLLTSLVEKDNPAWGRIVVPPLPESDGVALVEQLAGPEVAARFGARIAEYAGGLPVQIVPAATALAYEQRRSRLDSASVVLARETSESFGKVYQQLEQPARLLLLAAALLNPRRILRDELSRHLCGGLGWSEAEFGRALDSCVDLHLLEGIAELRMHQLLATFLRQVDASPEDREAVGRIRLLQRQRFVELAESLQQSPADADIATRLLSYPVNPQAWVEAGQPLSIDEGNDVGMALLEIGRFEEALPWFLSGVDRLEQADHGGQIDNESLSVSLHNVGSCLSRMGQDEEARPWFERAVKATQKGDVQGRIDHDSLGSSLHQVGYCLSSTGQYEQAQPWYERAVEAKQKGDVHGRIDHGSLGRSLHQMGVCLSSTGQFEEARPWYERAVEAMQKGDVYGRIDHEHLGRSLHQVGQCLSELGQYEEARPWYERAVEEAEKGDVHGRIDHNSLGRSLHQVGWCLTELGRYEEAQSWFERALEAKQQGDVHGRIDHAELGRSLHQVGVCLASTSLFEGARPWFERAVEAKQKGDVYGRIDHASLAISLRDGAEVLRRLGEVKTAEEWERRAVEADQAASSSGESPQAAPAPIAPE